MGKVTILPETTKNPISLIGERAGICWGADTTNQTKNYNRGLDCIESGHGRTFEFVNIEAVLDGYSARVIREWYTHIGGAPTRLQESTRYINYGDFKYVTPNSISSNGAAKEIWDNMMESVRLNLKALYGMGIPKEDVALGLPIGMNTKIVDKRNLRNVIDMSRQRMCNRANWEYRRLFNDYLMALSKVSDEWEYIITTQMKPKCEVLGYCPEKKSCGRMPKVRNETD